MRVLFARSYGKYLFRPVSKRAPLLKFRLKKNLGLLSHFVSSLQTAGAVHLRPMSRRHSFASVGVASGQRRLPHRRVSHVSALADRSGVSPHRLCHAEKGHQTVVLRAQCWHGENIRDHTPHLVHVRHTQDLRREGSSEGDSEQDTEAQVGRLGVTAAATSSATAQTNGEQYGSGARDELKIIVEI